MTLVNGSFETPFIGNGTTVATVATGWTTGSVAPVNRVEVWNSPFTAGVPGLLPYPDGLDQLVELDSLAQFLEQSFTVPSLEGSIAWGYWSHRRSGNGIRLRLGDAADPVASNAIVESHNFTDDAWQYRSGSWPKPAGVTSVRFRFELTGALGGIGILVDGATATFVPLTLNTQDPLCQCCPAGLSRCRAVSVEALTFSRVLNEVDRVLVGNVATFANFQGSGVDVTVSLSGGETLTNGGALGLAVGVAPPTLTTATFTFSQPVMLRSVSLHDLDAAGNEQAGSFNPVPTSLTGPAAFAACLPGLTAPCVRGTTNNSTGTINFPLPVTSSLQLTLYRPNSLGQFLTALAFDLAQPAVLEPAHALLCDGVVRWFRGNGDEIDPGDLVDCPAG